MRENPIVATYFAKNMHFGNNFLSAFFVPDPYFFYGETLKKHWKFLLKITIVFDLRVSYDLDARSFL